MIARARRVAGAVARRFSPSRVRRRLRRWLRRPLYIAIPFAYDEDWIGGTYYIRNVIAALRDAPVPPDIVIVANDPASIG